MRSCEHFKIKLPYHALIPYVHWSTLQSLKVTVVVSENSQIVQCVLGGKARKNRDMYIAIVLSIDFAILCLQVEVLKKYSKKDDMDFHNKNGDTWLHEAAANAHKEATDYLLEHHWEDYIKNPHNNNKDTFIESALRSMKIDSKIIINFIEQLPTEKFVKTVEEADKRMKNANEQRNMRQMEQEKARRKQRRSFRNKGNDTVDGGEKVNEPARETTELHLVAYHGYYQLVKKLKIGDCINQRDSKGDCPIHVAAKHQKFRTLKELVDTFFKKDKDAEGKDVESVDMNAENEEGETVLHIAMKKGNAEVVKYLIKHGCNLVAKDKTGNTPLHDLVEKANQMTNLEPYVQVWNAVANEAKFWWMNECRLRETSSKVGEAYKRDVIYYLRSEVRNGEGLTVLQYATQMGLCPLVKAMIWADSFVDSIDNETVRVLVTNLMPTVRCSKIKYCLGQEGSHEIQMGDPTNKFDDSQNESKSEKMKFENVCDSFSDKNDKTLLDPILKISSGNKAAEIMAIEPLNKLIKDYWFVRQWFNVVMMILHLVHMFYYTYYVITTMARGYRAPSIVAHIADLTSGTLALAKNITNKQNAYNISGEIEVEPNYIYLLWPGIMLLPILFTFFYVLGNLCHVCGNGCRGVSAKGFRSLVRKNYEVESYIDLKDAFKIPSLLLSVTSALLPTVLPIMFFGFTLASLLVTSDHGTTFFTNTIIGSVFIGWLMTFYWTSSFEPVYRFTTALHHIILKDVLSFMVFYVFVLLAFGSGMYVLFEMVPELSEQYPTFNTILYALFLKGTFAGSRISPEEVSKILDKAGHNTVMFDFLFTSFIITTRMLFLNMITSTMMSTYRDFVGSNQSGWLQHSLRVSNTYSLNWLARKLLHPIFKKIHVVDRFIENHIDDGHFYIILSKRYLKENRLQCQDVKICQSCRCSSIEHDAKLSTSSTQTSDAAQTNPRDSSSNKQGAANSGRLSVDSPTQTNSIWTDPDPRQTFFSSFSTPSSK